MSSDFSPPRLDSFDPLVPAAPETTAVPADTAPASQPAETDKAVEPAGLTAEDLALIEALPDDEAAQSEPEEAAEPAEADEPAETDAAEDEQAETADKPTTDGDRPTDPEELAAWREERGIPEDATGYALPEIEEWEWLDEDKPALDAFGAAFHEADLPQASVDKVLRVYADRLNAVHAADKTQRDERRTTLKGEWGDQYFGHVKTMREYVAELPFGAELAGARLPSGRLLLNAPGAYEWLLGIAEARPVARTPEARLAEINQIRDTNIDQYHAQDLGREWASLTKSIAAKPSPRVESEAGLRAELAEITKLMNTDIDRYQNRPWKGSGKTASQRSLEIQRQLAGERAA